MAFKIPRKLTALCAALTFATSAQGNINTATIMASSASPSCLEYKVVGTCFWLFCTYFGCKVRTSIKVRHFLPEMVVSAYTPPAILSERRLQHHNNGVNAKRRNQEADYIMNKTG